MSNLDYALMKARQIPYTKGQNRHYSILLDKRGRVVSEGQNHYNKTSPRMKRAGEAVGLPDKTCIHSEALAIFRDKKGQGRKLIVVRIGADGRPLYSAPCPLCCYLIKEHGGIQSVEFSV